MKPKVAFICVHNSCRSQIAEALGKHLASDVFDSYSGGTVLVDRINPDGVKVIDKLYGIDMGEGFYSKLLEDLPKIDIVIKMGCNVVCPYLPGTYIEDWGIDDPTGKDEEEFIKVAKVIKEKIITLANNIKNNNIKELNNKHF
ncbi:MAG: arsenate reductase ArsC [Clostridium sp.]